jgi:hypothetical protein
MGWCTAQSGHQIHYVRAAFVRPLAREPAVKVSVDMSRDKMTTKPILFWPKPRSDIALHLDREADDFLVVDTNYPYELQKLYKLRREIPIFDPFPHYMESTIETLVITLLRVTAATTSSGSTLVRNCCER